jgi:hypothetical protein
MADGIPNLLLIKLRRHSRKTEQIKTGRVKQIFSNLCENFNDHKTLLSVIPTNDKYVCLFTGSLAAIAQVSIIAENELRGSY